MQNEKHSYSSAIYGKTDSCSTVISLPVPRDLCQQWLQPALRALAVGVKEGDDGALGVLGAEQPGEK